LFTIEMDWDETSITILDPGGEYEDMQVIMHEEVVYIRQYDFDSEHYDYCIISPKQMLSLIRAVKLPEGAYKLEEAEE
jgi:hypothetical protein